MLRTPLLAELPDALPERGVLLLRSGPGRADRSFRGAFLKNLTLVYSIRHAQLCNEDYYDWPWKTLIQDNDLIQRIGKALQKIRDAGRHGAVLVRIIIQGIDNTAWRHDEVEQHLVQLLTSRGAAVALLEVTGPRLAQAVLYRPTAERDPVAVEQRLDLQQYMTHYGIGVRQRRSTCGE